MYIIFRRCVCGEGAGTGQWQDCAAKMGGGKEEHVDLEEQNHKLEAVGLRVKSGCQGRKMATPSLTPPVCLSLLTCQGRPWPFWPHWVAVHFWWSKANMIIVQTVLLKHGGHCVLCFILCAWYEIGAGCFLGSPLSLLKWSPLLPRGHGERDGRGLEGDIP